MDHGWGGDEHIVLSAEAHHIAALEAEVSRLREEVDSLTQELTDTRRTTHLSVGEMNGLLRLLNHAIPVLQLAYRTHVRGDAAVGGQELEEKLATALHECMGDEGFQAWLKAQTA